MHFNEADTELLGGHVCSSVENMPVTLSLALCALLGLQWGKLQCMCEKN